MPTPEENLRQHKSPFRRRGLGDLPLDHLKLRREAFIREPRTRSIPADILQGTALKELAETAKKGSPPLGFDVTSTYDSRPVNAEDWVSNGVFLLDDDENTIGEVSYQIPPSYVGVLRGFRINLDPPGDFDFDQFNFKVQAGTRILQGFNNFFLGSVMNEYQDCWGIADENQFFKIIGTINLDKLPPSTGTDIQVQFYGNLLLKTGREIQFETANRLREAKFTELL